MRGDDKPVRITVSGDAEVVGVPTVDTHGRPTKCTCARSARMTWKSPCPRRIQRSTPQAMVSLLDIIG
jgi:hypothetical protein